MESEQQKTTENNLIHKDTVISEAIKKYPQIGNILVELGIHCVNCVFSKFETLEQGLLGHGGYTSKQVDEIIEMIDKFIREESQK